jgi:hypothetical protein
MIDKNAMRRLLKELERAAQEVLQQDSAFFEALQALKWEIDSDARVQSAVRSLEAAGKKVVSSFVPYIKVRVKTKEGIFALPRPVERPHIPAAELAATLTKELNNAASAVIMTGNHCLELETIINEAVAASGRFEKLASHIESAGHEVLISLDLSAYAHIRERLAPPRHFERAGEPGPSEETVTIGLSARDLDFLKSLGIKAV